MVPTEPVAVTVWLPAVLSVTAKLPTPLLRVPGMPSTAWPSVLVRVIVPA